MRYTYVVYSSLLICPYTFQSNCHLCGAFIISLVKTFNNRTVLQLSSISNVQFLVKIQYLKRYYKKVVCFVVGYKLSPFTIGSFSTKTSVSF